MAISKKDRIRAQRRILRVRGNLKQGSLPRASVFRSLKHFYGQIIDDNKHTTVASCSSQHVRGVTGDKKAIAHAVGVELAKRAKQKGIERVLFDRGGYRYHGRVRAFTEGLREGGIKV